MKLLCFNTIMTDNLRQEINDIRSEEVHNGHTPSDYLRRGDATKIQVINDEGSEAFTFRDMGLHTVQQAIDLTIENMPSDINPQTSTFIITNMTTGRSAQYRLNAHGHAKLII